MVVGKLDAVVFNTWDVAAVEEVLDIIVVCSRFDDVVLVASEVVSSVIANVELINIESVVASTSEVVFSSVCVTFFEVVAFVVVHGFVSSFV